MSAERAADVLYATLGRRFRHACNAMAEDLVAEGLLVTDQQQRVIEAARLWRKEIGSTGRLHRLMQEVDELIAAENRA